MKLKKLLSGICMLLMTMGMLLGCSSTYFSNTGKTALEEHILPAKTSSVEQEWQTGDLKVVYTVEKSDSSFLVSGRMQIDYSIQQSFPTTEYFRFYINFLDKNGTVINTYDISPNVGYRKTFPEKISFRNVPLAPQEAVGFTFNYWGIFDGSNSQEDSSGDWEIYFNPFSPTT